MLGDTGSKRVVHILLECILVSQACVKNSVLRGVGLCIPACTGADIPPFPVHAGIHPPSQCMLGYTPPCPVHAGIHPRADTLPRPYPPPWQTPPPRRPLQRTVRILLECILVVKDNYNWQGLIKISIHMCITI